MKMFKRWYDVDSAVSKAINELEKSTEEIQTILCVVGMIKISRFHTPSNI